MNGYGDNVLANALEALEEKVVRLEKTLWTLIAWMAQSANSPISRHEAEQLRQMLERETP